MIISCGETKHDLTNYILDSSTRHRKLKGEDTLTLKINLTNYIDFPIGSTCEYPKDSGLIYILEKPGNLKKRGIEYFEYTLLMEGSYAKLRKYKFREKTGDKFTKLKFSLTAKPQEHLQMLIDNLNERDAGKKWKIGKVVDAVEKTLSYSHSNCDEVLNMISNAFETEWEINGKTISICKVEYNTGKDGEPDPLPLSYGRGNGFKPGVGRSNYSDSNPTEKLFVQGGERNINYNFYHSKELLLPKGQRLKYEDREYISSSDGLSIERFDKSIVFNNEGSLDCSEIYPNKEHTVTKVECIDEKSKWDIFDTDNNVDYSLKDLRIAGETATIIFQSGMLVGKEFELKQTDNAITGYIHGERRFQLISQEIDGQTMPNKTFTPKVGDKFKLFGIALPQEYICYDGTKTGASWDMFREAAKYLYENENPQFTFTGELDGIWAKRNWNNVVNDAGVVEVIGIGNKIKLGGYIRFKDDQFHPDGTDIRIVGIEENINNPHSPKLELSNAPVSSSILSDLAKIDSNEVVVDDNHKEALQFTKRRYRDAKETIKMLEDSLLDFSNSINPVAVSTMSILVGDESLQYRFVEHMPAPKVEGGPEPSMPPSFKHEVRYDKDAKVLIVPAGVIQHLTLGVKNISSSHKASEYKFWNLPSLPSEPLVPVQKYWLYAKVTKECTTLTPDYVYHGEFIRSEKAIIMEGVDCYYLLVGVLNSEYDGARSYTSLYGYTEVLPGRITTDRIVSGDGQTYFDLESGEIGGNITFMSGGSKKTVTQLETDALADTNTKANAAKDAAITAAATDATRKANTAKDEARNDLSHELGYDNYEDMVANAQAGNTIIIGGHINTDLITFNQLKTSNGNVEINDGKAKIGDITILGDGDIFVGKSEDIKDVNNGVVISKNAIPTLGSLNASSNGNAINVSNASYTNSGTYNLSGSLWLPSNTATFSVSATISIELSLSSTFNGGRIDLFLVGGTGSTNHLGYVEMAGSHPTNVDIHPRSKSVQQTFLNLPAGSYKLQARVSYFGSFKPSNFKARVSSGKMSYIVSIMRTEIGCNGYLTAWNNLNYEHTAWSGSNLIKTFKGKADFFGIFKYIGGGNNDLFDIPGVLASYSVSYDTIITHRFGAKQHRFNNAIKPEGTVGMYKVPHNIDHANYTVSATATSSGAHARVCVVIEKTSTFALIGVADIGGGWYDNGFDITFYGRNS